MNLQNITLDYTNNFYSSLYENKIYMLVETTEMTTLKNDLEIDFNIPIEKIVIQLTYDQNLSEPRFILNPASENLSIVTLTELETNFNQTYQHYLILKDEVDTQINDQLN